MPPTSKIQSEGSGPSFLAHREDPSWFRYLLIGVSLLSMFFFVILPLAVVFQTAFSNGWQAYWNALQDPDALSAVRLTLLAGLSALLLNTLFGVIVAWLIAKFEFPGKGLLNALIDLPLSISPVIAGLLFVLLFGRESFLAGFLEAHDLKILFAVPGIVLATAFVTVPFVARELIPLMEEQGKDEEEAAVVLGASGWQTFFRVTLPNIRWGLLYGVILCNARAMGEYGAVSVVSGHIRGLTNTLPLQIEVLYNEYSVAAAFSLATLLSFLGLGTLLLKSLIEWRHGRRLKIASESFEEGA